jgi:hypothetical protein
MKVLVQTRMKINFKKIVFVVILILLAITLFLRISSSKKTPQINPKQLIIGMPGDYQIGYAHTVSLLKKSGSESKATIVAINGSITEPPHLDVYEDIGSSSYTKIYSFIPDIPNMKGFLYWIDKVTPIMDGGDPFSNLSGIFLSISQTGADYWGSYPVLIRYDKNKGFWLADFDSGNLSAESQIKSYMGPADKTLEIANQLDENNKAKSILAEGADFNYSNIELSFYTEKDYNSFGHTLVTLKFPYNY